MAVCRAVAICESGAASFSVMVRLHPAPASAAASAAATTIRFICCTESLLCPPEVQDPRHQQKDGRRRTEDGRGKTAAELVSTAKLPPARASFLLRICVQLC